MLTHRLSLLILALAMTALPLAAGFSGTASAQKGKSPTNTPTPSGPTAVPTATPLPTSAPPPAGGGWIYYRGRVVDDTTINRIAPDGSNQSEVTGAPVIYSPPEENCSSSPMLGMPSELPHDGSRWYLVNVFDNDDIVFPGMYGPYCNSFKMSSEVHAVREGDTTGVRLTDNRGSCHAALPGTAKWVSNSAGNLDAAISWLGVQWADQDENAADCETFVGAGIYRANLIYEDGAITGMAAPTLAVPLNVTSSMFPEARGFSWAPDASAVAYSKRVGSGYGGGGPLMRALAGSLPGSHTQLVAGTYDNVEWSPDQTTIAFNGRSAATKPKVGIWSVQPNGSGLKLLAQGSDGSNFVYPSYPAWSPTGSHLVYHESTSGNYGSKLRRMAKDGSGNVVLITDSDPHPYVSTVGSPLNWTDSD